MVRQAVTPVNPRGTYRAVISPRKTRETRAIKTAGMAPSHRAMPPTSKVSKRLAVTIRDPRDKDGDGWVADDKMREWGRDIKDAVKGAGQKMKEEGRELQNEGLYQMDEAERRRRRARVYDRNII